jgi:hypothetical protein
MLAPSPSFAAEFVTSQSQSQADYVGAAMSKQCHESELKAWMGSHHQLAMQEANADTVLGDFDSAKFKHYDVESTFFKRDGKFMMRTDGADGKLADFEISYVFGVWPLQPVSQQHADADGCLIPVVVDHGFAITGEKFDIAF